MILHHVAQRMFNTPLLIHPAKAEIIVAALAPRLGVSELRGADGAMFALADIETPMGPPVRRTEGYDVIGGVAVIEVRGTLVQRNGGSLRPYSGMTGYDGIRENLDAAVHDPEVRAIAFDIDSPGGEVAGCFDLVDAIAEAREIKTLWAILDEHAYSAAYAIASACNHITVPRTGGAGSIGVITMHADISKALSGAGIKVTIITHGARKADGASEIPLSDEARDRIQTDIDTLGELFIDTVAQNRALAPSKVRDMQAGTFLGEKAVAAGLADDVAAPDVALAALLDTITKEIDP